MLVETSVLCLLLWFYSNQHCVNAIFYVYDSYSVPRHFASIFDIVALK